MQLAVTQRETGTGRSRLVGAIAAALLIGILVYAVWELSRERRIQPQRLPDGSVVSLVAVTYGRQHSCTVGSGWQRLANSLFPNRKLWGGRSFYQVTPQDRLMAWWRFELPQGPTWNPPFYTACSDEHGCQFGKGTTNWLSSGPAFGSPPAVQVVAQQLPIYPRRSATFRLGFFNPWSRRQLAALTASNPFRKNYSSWKAEPYPIRRRTGQVEVTLLDLAHDQGHLSNQSGARFRITEEGKPTARWEPARLTVEDATGNQVTSEPVRFARDERSWFDGLCTHEAAWKIRMVLAPTYPVRVPPDFTWELRDLAVPSPVRRTYRDAQFRQAGIGLGFLFLNTPQGSPPISPGATRRVRAGVKLLHAEEGACLTLIRVRDERGRDLTSAAQGGPFARLEGGASQLVRSDREEYWFDLRLPPVTKRLNLTFAIHKAHAMEFLAKP